MEEARKTLVQLFLSLFLAQAASSASYFSNSYPIVVVDSEAFASHGTPRAIQTKDIVQGASRRVAVYDNYEPQRGVLNAEAVPTTHWQYQSPATLPPAAAYPLLSVKSPVHQPRAKHPDGNAGRKVRRQDYDEDELAEPKYTEEHLAATYQQQTLAQDRKGHDEEYSDHEEGEGGKHHEEGHKSHGEKGEKGYKSWHEDEDAKKGHHDKEHHKKDYEEEHGKKKHHKDEEGYYKQYHHDDKGEKGSKFEENGEYKKGHSTHGKHVIHKKDEYEKNVDFFDENHSEEEVGKKGGYHHEHKKAHGGKKKKGHYDAGEHADKYGKEKKYAKGEHFEDKEAWDHSKGDEGHHHHGAKYGKKSEHAGGKKWSHKH